MDLKSRGVNLYKLHNLRSIESYRELLSFKKVCFSYQTAIEELSRISPKEALWIEIAVKELSSKQKVHRWIEIAIKSYQECNKKKLKGLDK